MKSPFIWSKNQPTEPGWYWVRNAGDRRKMWGEERRITHVKMYNRELSIGNWATPDKDVEWAGPIPFPEDEG